jgi:hypothetical protein
MNSFEPPARTAPRGRLTRYQENVRGAEILAEFPVTPDLGERGT